MLSTDSLKNLMMADFSLWYHHKFPIAELDAMIPWQREAFIMMLNAQLQKEQEERAKDPNLR